MRTDSNGYRPRAALRQLASAAADGGSVAATLPEEVQRWTAGRRMALVFCVLKGELSADECARRHGLSVAEIDDWKARMLAAAHNALRSRPRAEDATKDEQIRRLQQKVGELVVDVDLLKEALAQARSRDGMDLDD